MPAASSPDLAIGFVGDLSGSDSDVARDQLDGFRLAAKHLVGRLGGLEFNLRVSDDRRDPAEALDAVRTLIAKAHVRFILLSAPAGATKDIVGAATAGHVLVINLGQTSKEIAGDECSPNLFSLAPPPTFLDQLAGQFFRAQGYRHPLVILPGTDAARNAASAFGTAFGGRVATLPVANGEMRFRSQIASLRKQPPDAVYTLLRDGMEASFVRQYAAAGLQKSIPLYGPATTLDRTRIDAIGSAGAGLFSIGEWSEDGDSDSNRAFVADFQNEYSRPSSIAASEGYDAALLLDAALKSTGAKWSQDEAMLSALRHADFPSVTGGFHFGFNQFPIQTYLLRQATDTGLPHLANPKRAVIAQDVGDDFARQCSMRWGPEAPAAKSTGKPAVKH
jgi:branched-chain amino acid transport system substrate-binding protein